jgi:hypothetical protein
MRLPRLTTRRLMAVVAMVAFVLAARDLWVRQAHHLALAERYLGTQEQDQILLDGYKNTAWMAQHRADSKDASVRQGHDEQYWREETIRAELGIAYAYKHLTYHRQMLAKHLRAAAQPWKTAPPDPAPPSWPDRNESTTWLILEMKKKANAIPPTVDRKPTGDSSLPK